MPRVTVLMPVFNSAAVVEQAVKSIQAQTFTDWEMIVVNDFGSDDGSGEILRACAEKDPRIILIEPEYRLGLARSLNLGIQEAKGEYIARLDADDTSAPTRLAKQVAFLDAHPEVGVCGSWQHHYGPDRDWVHRAPADPQMCRARLLFWCDLCHSTLMLRRSVFVDNSLYYDPARKAEDYDLWTRAMMHTEIANIPEVLGEYKEDGTGITDKKRKALHAESGQIVAATLNRLWGMELTEEQAALLRSWENDYQAAGNREEMLRELQSLLRRIWEANRISPFFEEKALLQVLACKWQWAKNCANWEGIPYKVQTIDDVFDDAKSKPSLLTRFRVFLRNNPSNKVRVKKLAKKGVKWLFRPLARFVRKLVWHLMKDVRDDLAQTVEGWTWDRYQRTNHDTEYWTWERFQRTNRTMAQPVRQLDALYRYASQHQNRQNRVPYHKGEKIRVAYLFQLPSCWPSFESVWEILKDDPRFEVKFLLFDREHREKAQMAGAREFLENLGIPYEEAERVDLMEFRPHVFFYQTPWDQSHRPAYLQSNRINEFGTRIAYIPYGIEYSNSVWPDYRFSNNKFLVKPWKVFCLSPQMRFEHHLQSAQGADHVVSTGLPKFDLIWHKDRFPLEDYVREKVAGRKVIFWQMHFPAKDGTPDIPEAHCAEYTAFARDIQQYGKDYFFLVRMHPKFVEQYVKLGYEDEVNSFLAYLKAAENVYMYNESNYMPALLSADAVIGDRSALMIEASALQVPVLYMTNFWYKEQMLDAVAPIFDSYYQGSQVYDMHRFMQTVLTDGFDYKKQEREDAFHSCIPFFDGQCGRRIVENIVDSLNAEAEG